MGPSNTLHSDTVFLVFTLHHYVQKENTERLCFLFYNLSSSSPSDLRCVLETVIIAILFLQT